MIAFWLAFCAGAVVAGIGMLCYYAETVSRAQHRAATLTGLNAALVQERDELRATVAAREADIRRMRAIRRA